MFVRTTTHIIPNTNVTFFKPSNIANVETSNGFISIRRLLSNDNLTLTVSTTWDNEINGLLFISNDVHLSNVTNEMITYLTNNPGTVILRNENISDTDPNAAP
jgi:hypothetical protein